MSSPQPALLLDKVRLDSLDLFRGLTILCMWWVNEMHALKDVPRWLLHTQAHENGMGLADFVFPAFLFAVGIAIPLSERNQMGWQGMPKILKRFLALLVMGLFMVNIESLDPAVPQRIPSALWLLIALIAFYGVWGNLLPMLGRTLELPLTQVEQNKVNQSIRRKQLYIRTASVATLLGLAFLLRSAERDVFGLHIHWWGILGLTAWAYLIAAFVFQFARGRIGFLMLTQALCLAGYMLCSQAGMHEWIRQQAGHFSHASIVLAGVICFHIVLKNDAIIQQRARIGGLWFAGMLLTFLYLQSYYPISKILATPTWVLLSVMVLMLVFAGLQSLCTFRNLSSTLYPHLSRTSANALLAYLIPYFFYACTQLLGLTYPWQQQGVAMGFIMIYFVTSLWVYLASYLFRSRIRFSI